MKIKITNSEPKLISFWDIYGKELDVKNTKTVNFASGPKNYYVVEFEGREYEVPEDMVDNSIPNNYEGKTPEQVWNAWTEDQREHFLKDHFKDKINPISQSEIIKSNYSGLFNWWNFNIKEKLEEHLKSGQYGKGGGVDNDEFQEAAEFLMDKTVFSYSLGQLEPTEHKIKGVHITPKHFNQRHLYFSFYGNEWPHNFNDSDRLTADQLGDFIAGEQVELKDSQGEPYIVALGDIASKGTKITVPRMEPEELTDVLYSKENNWADIGQAQMYVYQTPSVSDYLKRLHIIDLTGQSASKIKYPDGVYVFIAKVGNRYYYVNTEGYDYARYAVEIPGWFAREINMEKAAKGTKINEMENKNYYLKIGNIIVEEKKNIKIVGFDKEGINVVDHSLILKDQKVVGIDYPTFVRYMDEKAISIKDHPYETSRDKFLLELEINNIIAAINLAKEKAEVRKKEAEVSQAKHEADVLLKKAVETETAAKDTIEALAELTGESIYDRKLKAFLDLFPNDAKSWGQATDEIRDIAREVREAYNEQVLNVVEGDPGYVEGLNFREFGKPSQWNTEGKRFILKYWALLPENVKKRLITNYEGWFDQAGKGKMVGGGNGDSVYDRKLKAILAKFPDDAKSWEQATDDIRLIARNSRDAYNEDVLRVSEGSKGYIYPLNFNSFKTPSQWNTEAKKQILEVWPKLPEALKKQVLDMREYWIANRDNNGDAKRTKPHIEKTKIDGITYWVLFWNNDADSETFDSEREAKSELKKLNEYLKNTDDQAGRGKKVGGSLSDEWAEMNEKEKFDFLYQFYNKDQIKQFDLSSFYALPTEAQSVVSSYLRHKDYKIAAKGKKVGDSLTKKGRVAVGSRLDEFMWDAEELVYNMNPTTGWQKKVTSLLKKKGATQEEINKIIQDLPDLVNVDEEAANGKMVGYNPDMYYKKGDEVKVLNGYYKGKNGIVHDVDHDANHIEVEMGDGMIRFLELSDVKKIGSNENKAGIGTKIENKKLFKKEAKIGNYYHFRLNNPKGVKKCAVPSWASDLAGSVYEGAKITTCQKDGEWFAQNVMIPTKNISKLQARSYAQQIALKIKK